MKRYNIIIILLFLFGCSTLPVEHSKQKVISEEIRLDDDIIQKIEKILVRVERIAEKNNLDYLGRSTMMESVEILDMGKIVSSTLIEKLKISSNWKFRFWIVDIMGFISSKDNIIPLIEVLENNNEKDIVRMRACESLKELGYLKALEHLMISRDIVANKKIRTKITETIDCIR